MLETLERRCRREPVQMMPLIRAKKRAQKVLKQQVRTKTCSLSKDDFYCLRKHCVSKRISNTMSSDQ